LPFWETRGHGALVEGGLVAHAPAQVHRLKARAAVEAEALQAREDAALEDLALGVHVGEGGANEQPEYAPLPSHLASPNPRLCHSFEPAR
jgi:hypothetical protein